MLAHCLSMIPVSLRFLRIEHYVSRIWKSRERKQTSCEMKDEVYDPIFFRRMS
jgi:hypothetical protein